MSSPLLPLLVEADVLQSHLDEKHLLIVDLGKADLYARGHIPGAQFLDYGQIIRTNPPVGGLLPEDDQLSEVLAGIGLTRQSHVVAYDEEGGGKAARLLWTLAALGHPHYSLLNGGLQTWASEGHPLSQSQTSPSPSHYQAKRCLSCKVIADRQFILDHLHDPEVALLDVRSPEEFTGQRRYAERGGHIPGAVNIEWTQLMEQGHNLRLKTIAELRNLLQENGITTDKTIVTYCHTHHRSAHTWFALHYLGYRVLGYEGSWSDWGNRPDMPVEV